MPGGDTPDGGSRFSTIVDTVNPEYFLEKITEPLRDPSQYGRDEPFFESLKPRSEDMLFSVAALISAGYGVRSRGEIMFASLAHVVFWLTGNDGLDAITAALSSVQLAKGRYSTAALPTLKATYDTTRLISRSGFTLKSIDFKKIMEQIIYVTGMLLVMFKIL